MLMLMLYCTRYTISFVSHAWSVRMCVPFGAFSTGDDMVGPFDVATRVLSIYAFIVVMVFGLFCMSAVIVKELPTKESGSGVPTVLNPGEHGSFPFGGQPATE